MSGFITINKLAGNVHMALGESVIKDGRHLHSFKIEDAPKFNTSHTIHQLEFLDFDEPDVEELHNMLDVLVKDEEALALVLQNSLSSSLLESSDKEGKESSYTFTSRTKTHSPLNQFESKVDTTTGLFQYFIKLIPTVEEGTTFRENLRELTQKSNEQARKEERKRKIDAYWHDMLEEGEEEGGGGRKKRKSWMHHLSKLPSGTAGTYIMEKGIKAMGDYARGKLNAEGDADRNERRRKKNRRGPLKLFNQDTLDFLTASRPIPVEREGRAVFENPYLDRNGEEGGEDDDAIVVLSFPKKSKNQRNKEKKEGEEGGEGEEVAETHFHAISSSIHPHHYTFTRKFRPLVSIEDSAAGKADPNESTVLPGIFFSFDFSPFMIELGSSRKPWLHLLVRCVSIVGGVLTVRLFHFAFVCVIVCLFRVDRQVPGFLLLPDQQETRLKTQQIGQKGPFLPCKWHEDSPNTRLGSKVYS